MNGNIKIVLPKHICEIIGAIEDAGYPAYAVGGCVRDSLMGKTPHDYDIASAAPPDRIAEIFPHTVPTGIKYGTVTVIAGGESCEVTMFRSESGYTDRRHPSVSPADSIESDLSRRDLTVNAMAYNPRIGLVDPFCGREDIARRIIRTVGAPEERFGEDALRIMRAFRFSAQLEFDIDPDTADAAVKLANDLRLISVERIAAELMKTLAAARPSAIGGLIECGALDFLGLAPAKILALDDIPAQATLRLAALCVLCGADAFETGEKLRLPRKTVGEAREIQNVLLFDGEITHLCLKRFLQRLSPAALRSAVIARALLLQYDPAAQLSALGEIIDGDMPYLISQLEINGNELKALGINGADIGRTLRRLLCAVMDDPSLNKKDILKALAVNKLTM